MKIYKTQAEVDADIKDGVLTIKGDVEFECSIVVKAHIVVTGGDITANDIDANNIKAGNIKAGNIEAGYIEAGNINAGNIDAHDIEAGNINAGNIDAYDIEADNINADKIEADDITADNINAGNISYFAFCTVYKSIKCLSIKARRQVHHKPICLDGKLEIVQTKPIVSDEITLDGKTYVLKEEKL